MSVPGVSADPQVPFSPAKNEREPASRRRQASVGVGLFFFYLGEGKRKKSLIAIPGIARSARTRDDACDPGPAPIVIVPPAAELVASELGFGWWWWWVRS